MKDEQQRDQLLQQAIAQNLSLNEIKARIKEAKPDTDPEATPEQVLVGRMTEIIKQMKKSKAWNDSKKHDQITKLLNELTQLTEEA